MVRPARLFRMVMAVGAPWSSRTTSKTENGRRRMVSVMSAGRTMTNCPAWVRAPTSAADKVSTL